MRAMTHRSNFIFVSRGTLSRMRPNKFDCLLFRNGWDNRHNSKRRFKMSQKFGGGSGANGGWGAIHDFFWILVGRSSVDSRNLIPIQMWEVFYKLEKPEKRVLFAPFAPPTPPVCTHILIEILISKMTYRTNAKFFSRTHSFGPTTLHHEEP